MQKIVVIGAGFGGLSAVEALSRSARPAELDIILIDGKETSDFLPMLPDILGRKILPAVLTNVIEKFCVKKCCRFINQEVIKADLEKKRVSTVAASFDYDYLIIASGSEVNFYGNEAIKGGSLALDSVEDTEKLCRKLAAGHFDNLVISGGGYTGVETATNLRLWLDKTESKAEITIIERAPGILGSLPEWIREYTQKNLERLGIRMLVNKAVNMIEQGKIYLDSGEVIENAILIWSAGVKTSGFVQGLKLEKTGQGRLKVDEYLRVNVSSFVIGDAASVFFKGSELRMAVRFAIAQGKTAAANIIRSIRGRGLKKYRPRDIGYIIPMANNRSCGIVLGMRVRGALATFLHYVMCLYRARSFKNKFGILTGLLTGGAK